MNKLKLLTFILVSFVVFACNNDDKSSDGSARFELRLTDSPAKYEAVNIDIQSVSINATDDINAGWTDLDLFRTGIYNLLNFQNGIDTLLAAQDIPAGKISQIRLVLGTNNSVIKNGVKYSLEIPSGQQSGLKLNLQAELTANITYRLWIDFDASRSIVETGSGKFQLKPVIRTYSEATSGAIQGIVLPKEAKASVWAILGADSLLALPDTITGNYLFPGLTPGTSWKLLYETDKTTGYQDSTINNVVVSLGNVTVISQMNLRK